jgi:VWFA-related protein
MRTIVIALGLSIVQIASAHQSGSPQESSNTPRFRVATDGVRIDAVVTDRDGRIVSDLTADDFEVRQDGKLQKLLFAQFVPVLSGPPAPSVTSVATNELPSAAPDRPPAAIRRDEVQRTLAIVVDDLSLSAESYPDTRRALHAFVDSDLRPTDLVALLTTGGSMGTLQPFTIDRRILHAAIDRLQWNGRSRNGVEAFEPINKFFAYDTRSGLTDPSDSSAVNNVRRTMSGEGSLSALNLIVQGARDLPGRKAVVFVSEGFGIMEQGAHDNGAQPSWRLRPRLDRVIEQATRAGVVIYSLDCRGLQSAGLQAADNLKIGPLQPDGLDQVVRGDYHDRRTFNRDTQEGLAYVAEQTGGFAIMNTNDLATGLAHITNDVRDYYVIGYSPAEGTFVAKGKKPSIHKISIKVKRPGLTVKTRKEFLGVSDPDETTSPRTPAQQLVHAATSPFAETTIGVRATTLPGYSPDEGSYVRALLHIDASALKFADDNSGKKAASVDVLGMVFDHEGVEVAHVSTGFSVALTSEGAADALRDGLAYTLRIPIRKSGAYQLRFALRDQESGALGSTGEYVEIPDTAGGAFSLSGIVLRSDADPPTPGLDGADQITVTPTQAVRVYPRGARLSYAYEIYNATGPVQAAMSIWRGPEKVLTPPASTLVPPPGSERVFAAGGGVKLGEGLPPGNYVLEIAAATSKASAKTANAGAVQRIDFEVR